MRVELLPVNSEEVACFLLALAPCEAAAVLTTATVKQRRYREVMQVFEALVLADASDPRRAAACVRAAEYRLVQSGALPPETLRAWRQGHRGLRPRQLLRVGEQLLQSIEIREPGTGGPPPTAGESLVVTEGPALIPSDLPARPLANDWSLFLLSLPSAQLRARLASTGVTASRGVNCVLLLTSGLAELIWYHGLTWENALTLLRPDGILPEDEVARLLSRLQHRLARKLQICPN